MARFENKVVMITGASSGIGAATALRIAGEGGKIFGLGRDAERLAATEAKVAAGGGEMISWVTDIAQPTQCREAVAQCVAQCGQLDALINCAGGHIFRALHEITEDNWLQDIANNLGGSLFLCQAAVPQLLKTAGNIVNIGSLASVEGQPYSATYCSAKHGIIGLTKSLALEFIDQPIRINAVCPGGTNTPQLAKVGMPDGADFDLIMTTAAKRGLADAEDIAAVIAFIASSDAKAVHGAVYMADMGKTI